MLVVSGNRDVRMQATIASNFLLYANQTSLVGDERSPVALGWELVLHFSIFQNRKFMERISSNGLFWLEAKLSA